MVQQTLRIWLLNCLQKNKRNEEETWHNFGGGRFTKETDKLVYNFNASHFYLIRSFIEQDIRGSIAHVKMLAKQGILTEEDRDADSGRS